MRGALPFFFRELRVPKAELKLSGPNPLYPVLKPLTLHLLFREVPVRVPSNQALPLHVIEREGEREGEREREVVGVIGPRYL